MTWNKKEISPSAVKEMVQRFQLEPLPASILLRRGILEPRDLCFFLEDDLRFLHNPFLFNQMELAVDRILLAAEEEERVMVFGDRDVDGITSTVLLVEALRETGLDPKWRVPVGDDAYGLSIEAVEAFAAEDGSLILTVDNGITCLKEIERAAELGIDVIVLDHHEPQENLPAALAVINPKVPGEGYPFRDLAGCGVASRLVWALAFSRSDIYNQSFVLLHSEPLDEDRQLEALTVTNLLPGEELSFPLSRGENYKEGLMEMLQGRPLICYRKEDVLPALRDLFGASVDIELQELAPRLAELSPSFKGKSLLDLTAKSRSRLYGWSSSSHLATLNSLFVTLFFRSDNDRFQGWVKGLDLVAIGTIADMMPLKNENRILVQRGLEQLFRTERKPLREILLRKKLNGRPVNAKDVAWYISPWLNSSGRMKQADLAVNFLLESEDSAIYELGESITRLNDERRELGSQIWKDHLQETEESKEAFHGKMVLLAGEQIPRGISGILATRFQQYFSLPAVVIARQGETLSGSIRAPRGFPIQDYLASLADLFDDWGGHEFAAGFSLPRKEYETFRRRTRQYLEKWDGRMEIDESLDIDAELPHEYLNEKLFDLVERFAPYGEDFPPLLFCARKVLVEKVDLVGKESSHVKLLLKTDENRRWPAFLWNSVDRLKRDFSQEDQVDVLFHLEENYFRSQRSLQWNVIDIQRS